jgi:hypothetical protein
MAVLTQCVECGRSVSSEADNCPHCNKYPRFIKCGFCDQELKISESFSSTSKRLHRSCFESLVSAISPCPVCSKKFEYSALLSYRPTCPNCGQSLDSLSCDSCGLKALRSDLVTLVLKKTETTVRVHRRCAVKYNISKGSGLGVAFSFLIFISFAIFAFILVTKQSPNISASSSRKVMARLTGAAEFPGPGDPKGSGTAQITFDPDKGEVCFDLTVANIQAATAAHIHEGSVRTEGPVKVLLVAPTTSSAKGCKTADATAIRGIMANPANYYVNVHNAVFPKGAVRGQLSVQ